MPRLIPAPIIFAIALFLLLHSSAQAGRYGGHRYVRPRIVENIAIIPPPLAPPHPPTPIGPVTEITRSDVKPSLPVENTAEATARETLKRMGESPPHNHASLPRHIGVWKANVGTQVRIQLTLDGNGTFKWVVENSGRKGGFDGKYDLSDGRLTLTRRDKNSLSLKMTEHKAGFNLRAPSGQDAGLDFVPD